MLFTSAGLTLKGTLMSDISVNYPQSLGVALYPAGSHSNQNASCLLAMSVCLGLWQPERKTFRRNPVALFIL